ncbi:DUF4296 domain-containing protein [Psychroserpens mesophilus]|uniref:DUF4296 domain-containing protein n=1 Tax=Psychroserpens mesophilus TaxID=325473 RepID=UPI003D65AAA1
MIKRVSLLLLFLALCFACNQLEKPEKPDDLISKNKMVDILFDVYVFNAAKGTEKRVLEKNNVTPEVFIFQKHGIDSLQFVKSNEYYAYDIDEYEEMIKNVEAKIKAKKDIYQKELDLEEERRQKRLDSIKNIGDTLKYEKPKKKLITPVEN